MPKVVKPRHSSNLASEITDDSVVNQRRGLARQTKAKYAEKPEQDEEFVDSKMSRKILDLARAQQEELEIENDDFESALDDHATYIPSSTKDSLNNPQLSRQDERDRYDDDDEEEFAGFAGDDEVEELEIDEADQDLFEKLMPTAALPRQSLADMIMTRIQEQEEAARGKEVSEGRSAGGAPPQLPAKVIEVYTKVGVLLSRYKSGKLPKAFKIIPSLRNWEDILYLTRPDQWSPNACYEATRLLVSNLTANQCQRFITDILLERVRDDIQDNKKLNFHLYMALKKALYKPAAFFKGFLFPLVQSGSCTLKEGAIVASVLTKVSVPVLHSAAALLRLAEMEFSGPAALFIRVLLDKKYALPFKVVDALVFHFIRWKSMSRPFAVLEHQSLLVFTQRYKNDMTVEQKESLLDIVKVKGHDKIGPEILRELRHSINRGDPLPPDIDVDMQL
ncbi:Bystin-family protein [Taphrina deformans PYCC 5710]|uniref:Bystin n=1 Tax=Taphrina deformans (strain PYCC 5710 / ATCC 11124 / CBS 356.35 / IMI 108563 / JCM 9778 / NBRC 8474) TaxID=1097556 RepID=R4XEI0_TAPDE|nr:Bystin-family protein [Taphrina deformans PYCC 5710]|eukprot:CCG81777.1 Bystin-family protein [Taphrina deformans PYCC 5710]